jgi:transposase
MTEMLTVVNERVDDIPMLQAQMQGMGLVQLLDQAFSTHGNWQGLSLGWVVTLWLTHILTKGDHRLNHVRAWVQKRLRTLCGSTGQLIQELDFTDDRLELVLLALSQDDRWAAFEAALSGQLVRVYDLATERVRLDSTSASGYWTVTAGGLFQFGHSKDHRPDLPQVKVMLAALDPLGLPLATDVLCGQRADDPLYIPAIQRVRAGLKRRGLLYVGDCKMATLETRAFVQAGQDFYLCPLPAVQVPAAEMTTYLQPVWDGAQALTPVYREQANDEQTLIAEGYERPVNLTAVVAGQVLTWTERRLVVRSLQWAQASEAALRTRLAKAVTAIQGLNERKRGKKRLTAAEALRQAVAVTLARHKVQDLVRVSYGEQITQQPVRRYADRPATIREERQVRVTAVVDAEAVQAAVRRLGWRVYGTNQPPTQLSLKQAVLAYRSEYIIEHSFGRLKGQPLSLTPMYLQRDDYATGLVRLLSIGLRVLTLLEFVARRRLSQEQVKLAGLYAGNPKRATAQPTAELLLEAFDDITLTVIHETHKTPDGSLISMDSSQNCLD